MVTKDSLAQNMNMKAKRKDLKQVVQLSNIEHNEKL